MKIPPKICPRPLRSFRLAAWTRRRNKARCRAAPASGTVYRWAVSAAALIGLGAFARNRLRQGVMAAADQSLVAPPQPFEEVSVASRSNFPAGPRSGLATSLSESTNFGVSVCSAKLGANRIRSYAGGCPASACRLAGGRRLVRRYGNYCTDSRRLGVGSDRDLTARPARWAIRRASTRLSRPNWRPSACAKHATAGQ